MMRVHLLARVVLLRPEAYGVSVLLGRAWPNISVQALPIASAPASLRLSAAPDAVVSRQTALVRLRRSFRSGRSDHPIPCVNLPSSRTRRL